MASKETALAPVQNFSIVNKYENMDPELREELQEQMGDLDAATICCNVVKIPSGTSSAFEVLMNGDPDNSEPMKEITGVVAFTHRMNAFWPEKYGSGDGQNLMPTCSSMDGKTGIDSTTGEAVSCDTCPRNAFGSGEEGRGKACRNMRRIYLICSGDPTPYLITVPPTSIKDVNNQLARIVASGTPYTQMVVRFKLNKAKNASGTQYNKISMEKAGLLPAEAAAAITQLRREIKAQHQSMAISADEAAPAAQQPARQDNNVTPPPMEYNGDFEDAPLPF